MIKNTSFRQYHIEKLRDQKHAKAYLEVALEDYHTDHNKADFLLALKDIVEAQGGISALAKKSHLNRQSLYKVLSENGNPRLDTLDMILTPLGFRLSIVEAPVPPAT